jgi:predicted NBD/HSP70 family sugar kinase
MLRTTADIRRANSFAIVRSIHAMGETSRRDLARATGLSFATVSSICGLLTQRGIVVNARQQKSPVGRPTGRVALSPDHGILLGVDIAETYILVETFGTTLELLSATQIDLAPAQRTPDDVVARVRTAVTDELARHDDTTLLGTGISVPGLVNPAAGTSIFAPNWDWHDVPLQAMLASSVPGPILVDNPMKYLTIAESWLNPERLRQNYVVLNLGTGVGAGVATDGQLLRGRTNSAGEWGRTVLVAGGRPRRCGSRGCVEAYIGAPGIIETLHETAPDSPLLRGDCPGDDQDATISALAEGAGAGDPVALAVIERTAAYLGAGIASLVNLLNPDCVVVGGWVAGQLGERLLDDARPTVRTAALGAPFEAVSLVSRPMRADSVSLGAAAAALEHYLDAAVAPASDTSEGVADV